VFNDLYKQVENKSMQALSLKGELNLIQTKGIQAGSVVKMQNGNNIKITKISRDHLGSSHLFDFDNLTSGKSFKSVKMQYIF
jgi:hypothetical protein